MPSIQERLYRQPVAMEADRFSPKDQPLHHCYYFSTIQSPRFRQQGARSLTSSRFDQSTHCRSISAKSLSCCRSLASSRGILRWQYLLSHYSGLWEFLSDGWMTTSTTFGVDLAVRIFTLCMSIESLPNICRLYKRSGRIPSSSSSSVQSLGP